MKIGIDARFLTHLQPGGFKTYTENLVHALARVDTENQYVLYVDRSPEQRILPNHANFEVRVVPGLLPVVGMPWREQLSLPHQINKDQVDLFHSPCLTAPLRLACPLVVTVHDMIWAFPEEFSQNSSRSIQRKLMEWYNRLIPSYAIKRASAIITVSCAAKESITKHTGLSSDHIFVTHEAANPSFQQIKDAECIRSVYHKHNLRPNFILAIGSADPRKNISRLLTAYSLLSNQLKEDHPLVVVWTHSFLADETLRLVEHLGLKQNVQFLAHISNDDLTLLYASAELFAFPSLYEGFGLPLLEAMACGVPVVAANNSSIPEIAGDAALLFDAEDVEDISNAINRILTDDLLRSALSKKGLKRAAFFSWEKCAREAIDVYKAVFEAHQFVEK